MDFYIQIIRRRINRIFAGFLCLFIMLMSFCPVTANAAEPEQKIVRVGYVNAATYEESGEGEYKRGSGYEYLQKISYITGWKYEYVYGSFKECYDKLVSGDIDLFGNISYTPERAELFDFSSYTQGKDTYLLYTTKERSDLTSGDIHRLNGCKIGVTNASYQEKLLREWLAKNSLNAEVLVFDGYDTLMSALDNGELDVIATPDLATSYGYAPIINIGFSDYYFAVSKSRPDLLKELNEALYEIQSTEMDYNNLLVSRYQSKMLGWLLLNEKEKQWLEAHNNTINLGYIEGNLPYCGEENGQLVGIMKILADTLEENFDIQVKTKGFSDREQLRQALRGGEIDILGPVFSDFYLAERNDHVLTNAIMTTTPLVIYNGNDVDSSLNVIAATDINIYGREVIEVLFPNAEIYLCDTQDECLEAVASGKAGSTLVASSQLNVLRSNPVLDRLSYAEMAKKTEICLVSSKANCRVASIVNKGILLSSDLMNGVVLAQHTAIEKTPSLIEFVREYALFLIILACGIILVLGIILYHLILSRKKLAGALVEANSANVAKTTFLSNMSHDIRTPMNAIIGFTTIAQKHDPSPEVKRCLQKIEESSDHLLTLINDVLDISRIESGKAKINPIPVDITAITDVVLDITNGFLNNRDICLRVNRAKLDKPYVLADPVRIREVLVNILSNAVKFTNDGGTITFSSDYHSGHDDRHIVVSYQISDTGIGMSEEFQKHIFEEFAQENSGARTQYKGTGLGMAITKRYVDLMGGTISVQSEKNKGTTFTVELPLELTEKEAIQKQDTVDVGRNPMNARVLVAEDNDMNAEIVTIQLEEAGMRVTRAIDGKQAVELFSDSPAGAFDVILMDIMMPQMNGYEATKAIRSLNDRPDGRRIPIIAMTANAFAEDVQASLDAGMNGHLSKPLVMDEVLKTISRLLQ